jgi:hypothetical protein
MVIPHTIEGEYIIANNNCLNYSIIYNTNTNSFTIKNIYYVYMLPDSTYIHKSFVIKENDVNISHVTFGRITGLHFVHILTKYTSTSISYEFIYDSEDSWNKSIELIESTEIYEIYDNALANDMCSYIFCGDDKIDERRNYWYLGKWKEYTELGIKSDFDSVQASTWVKTFGIKYNIEKYEKYELLCFDEFKDIIQYYPFIDFTCDNCSKNINISETFFCINNAFNNLCIDCHTCGEHKFKNNIFKLIDNDIYKSMFVLHSKTLKNTS